MRGITTSASPTHIRSTLVTIETYCLTFASIKMYGARSRGAARPALLPSALVTWWRVNFRTCGSHSSKTTCPFHGFSAKFKIHAKPAFDRCQACRDPDQSAVIPASQSRSLTAPFEVASGAFRRRFWTKILFFTRFFEKKKRYDCWELSWEEISQVPRWWQMPALTSSISKLTPFVLWLWPRLCVQTAAARASWCQSERTASTQLG